MKSHNVIALDVGDRRIGVAVASLEAKLPRPLVTIDRQTSEDITEDIAKLANQETADTIVVGLPRNLRGDETAQTRLVRDFARQLADKLPAAKIRLIDEAATSVKATNELESRGKPYNKSDIDKLAACYILEDWLGQQVGMDSHESL